MGCWCYGSERQLPAQDKYGVTERQLNLHQIEFREFFQILHPLCHRDALTCDDISKAFRDYLLSNDVTDESQSTLKKVLNCQYFQKQEGICPLNLMSLGILYTSGTYEQKADAASKVCDRNCNGEVFITTVKALVRGLFMICAFIIPAIHKGQTFEGLNDREEIELTSRVANTVLKLFQENTIKMSTKRLKEELSGNMRFVLDSGKVRELFRSCQFHRRLTLIHR